MLRPKSPELLLDSSKLRRYRSAHAEASPSWRSTFARSLMRSLCVASSVRGAGAPGTSPAAPGVKLPREIALRALSPSLAAAPISRAPKPCFGGGGSACMLRLSCSAASCASSSCCCAPPPRRNTSSMSRTLFRHCGSFSSSALRTLRNAHTTDVSEPAAGCLTSLLTYASMSLRLSSANCLLVTPNLPSTAAFSGLGGTAKPRSVFASTSASVTMSLNLRLTLSCTAPFCSVSPVSACGAPCRASARAGTPSPAVEIK
mmetsp:Transcript_11498/g.29104  ORF Transcript_11498/g.29104 Transcript_11498/m.29104 type:complete len:259 (+) Transcript_11498:818-1594(+)